MNWGLSGQIVVMNVSNLLPFYETKHRRVLVTTCFRVCPFLAPPNHWLTVASIGPFIRLLQTTEMPVSRFVLLLLAAKAEAQRPSLRQPQALTTDDKIAASRARTSADPAARSVPAASAGLALLAHPNPISNPNPNPNPTPTPTL